MFPPSIANTNSEEKTCKIFKHFLLIIMLFQLHGLVHSSSFASLLSGVIDSSLSVLSSFSVVNDGA